MNFFINQAMGLGNSGVEHAEFYRAQRFQQAQLPYRFVFLNLIPELHQAIDRWHLNDHMVLNLWEYLVLGDNYLQTGLLQRQAPRLPETVVDLTQTNRKTEEVTSAGIRIVQHYYKGPDKHHSDNQVLQVRTARVELYNELTQQRKVMYEVVDDQHRGHNVINIHLFSEHGQHLFFANLDGLHEYFFDQLRQVYPGINNFLIDRGEFADDILMRQQRTDTKIIYIIHADHLADRDDPSRPLWNDHYEYLLDHLSAVDAVVTATELQRQDLLLDFPKATNKIVAIPVGGIREQPEVVAQPAQGKVKKLVTASRLAAEKHLEIAVKAVVAMHQAGYQLQFDIYGQGEQKEPIEKLIKTCRAEDYIQLRGLSDDLEHVYPRYDAFISASFSEGFGLTYIEALNAGLPVITFDARFGAQELIKDGQNGFLATLKREDEDYNVNQLKLALQRYWQADPVKLSHQTRASVRQYQDQNIAQKWRKLLDGLSTSK
ncbi:Poly(glycerol-phosphate) alpha-glucosyltransferase GftA [Fructilactobacillus florum 8D]|uniref:Poly(Glycerol-phosphate) alpha-glucosyltransferase GftA n=1 Tax=Fructilactobacillus florum 8D TaxID=1221538 RepID=W9EIE7_9LACO|nr:glycosyltransferase [Fructilactobacillus florum]EKK20615.1 Poly(glycerol-phosphate) alpha-glucosyltransferase GftA [Fructilactobacillus florum 2F]ETO41046.1 Poly(glycerol-phosphate) alpha-glucosyltransferase GftA [Fructilactobacillus florum 8D]